MKAKFYVAYYRQADGVPDFTTVTIEADPQAFADGLGPDLAAEMLLDMGLSETQMVVFDELDAPDWLKVWADDQRDEVCYVLIVEEGIYRSILAASFRLVPIEKLWLARVEELYKKFEEEDEVDYSALLEEWKSWLPPHSLPTNGVIGVDKKELLEFWYHDYAGESPDGPFYTIETITKQDFEALAGQGGLQ